MTKDFDKAKWESYQGLNDEDIMDAIQGSVAIPLAIKSGDWHYAFRFIKDRIENKMIRRTELDMYNTIKTESIDDDDEMRELRTLWLKMKLRG
jgi:hypothetical protein